MFQKIYLFSLASLSFIFVLPEANAKIQEFKLKENSFSAELPAGWLHVEDALNVPLTLFSPMGSNEYRTVVQVTPANFTDKNDLMKKVPKDSEEYVRQKEDWLENVDGQSISYDSYHEEMIAGGGSVFSIGVTYSIPAGKFHQQTFYVSDKNKRLYFITSLTPLDLDEKNQVALQSITRSIASVK